MQRIERQGLLQQVVMTDLFTIDFVNAGVYTLLPLPGEDLTEEGMKLHMFHEIAVAGKFQVSLGDLAGVITGAWRLEKNHHIRHATIVNASG
eukprot:6356360-Amphidinium_carterae.1